MPTTELLPLVRPRVDRELPLTTDADLANPMIPVRDVMRAGAIAERSTPTVRADAPLSEAVTRMIEHHTTVLAVVERWRCVGIVRLADLWPHMGRRGERDVERAEDR
jgi:CBS domain-containing protein